MATATHTTTVKLGGIVLPDYAAGKPIGIRSNGELIYPAELLEGTASPAFGLSLESPANKIKLAVERLEREPDFEFGVLNDPGKYSKQAVIKNIQDQTPIGSQFTDIEVKYAEYFTKQLLGDVPAPSKRFVPPKTPDAGLEIPKEWRWVPGPRRKLFKSRVLFCENTTDGVTTPAADYRIANVHTQFAKRGFDVISLEGANDTRANFMTRAQDSLVVYISGVGHGNYSTYTGDQEAQILQVGAYGSAEVKGKAIHLLSCETARDLGPDTVKNGANAFVGYTENFVFDWAQALLYWQCDSQFDISMANGRTVEQAVADTYAKYDAAIASLPGTSTAATLLADKNLLRSPVSGSSWGSKTVRLSPSLFSYISLSDYLAR